MGSAKYTFLQELDFGYDRTCSTCGEKYAGLLYCLWRSPGRTNSKRKHMSARGFEARIESARNRVVRSCKRGIGSRSVGALCPHCGSFDSELLSRFYASGFRQGLIDWVSSQSSSRTRKRATAKATKWLDKLSEAEAEKILKFFYWAFNDDLWLMVSRSEEQVAEPEHRLLITFSPHSKGFIGQDPWATSPDGPGKMLKQAMGHAKNENRLSRFRIWFPPCPETKRENGHPGRWNWHLGYGCFLRPCTRLGVMLYHARRILTTRLRYLFMNKSHLLDDRPDTIGNFYGYLEHVTLPSATVVTTRMDESTGKWKILVVHPNQGVVNPIVKEIAEAAMLNVSRANPRSISKWTKNAGEELIPAMEFADESRIWQIPNP